MASGVSETRISVLLGIESGQRTSDEKASDNESLIAVPCQDLILDGDRVAY